MASERSELGTVTRRKKKIVGPGGRVATRTTKVRRKGGGGGGGGGSSFSKAFKAARDAGQKVFSWGGKSYTTRLASERGGGGGKTASVPTPKPRPGSDVGAGTSAPNYTAATAGAKKSSGRVPQNANQDGSITRGTTPGGGNRVPQNAEHKPSSHVATDEGGGTTTAKPASTQADQPPPPKKTNVDTSANTASTQPAKAAQPAAAKPAEPAKPKTVEQEREARVATAEAAEARRKGLQQHQYDVESWKATRARQREHEGLAAKQRAETQAKFPNAKFAPTDTPGARAMEKDRQRKIVESQPRSPYAETVAAAKSDVVKPVKTAEVAKPVKSTEVAQPVRTAETVKGIDVTPRAKKMAPGVLPDQIATRQSSRVRYSEPKRVGAYPDVQDMLAFEAERRRRKAG
jgi:hypothetical protein